MDKIYRINRWYDRLDDTHPTLRFMMFIIPMIISQILIFWVDHPLSRLVGVVIMGTMLSIRIAPILVKRP